MASCHFHVSLCAVVAILVWRVEQASACDTTAATTCATTYTNAAVSASTNKDTFCAALKTYLTCSEAATISDCTSGLKSAYDGLKSSYTATCGAAHLLMSWPMYIAVLALSLKRLYSSAM